MFDPLLHPTRLERAPTELDAWAQCEAKSPTTAGDLLHQATAHTGTTARSRRLTARRRGLLLTFSLAIALVFYWLM